MNWPRVNESGEIDLQSVEALSRDDLREWVYERLHGRDLIVPGSRGDDMPHYLFALLYPKLSRFTREDLQNILLEFMADLGRNPDSSWLGKPGDELLMLVDPVLVQSPRREEVVDLLLHMADASHLMKNGGPNLHFRAVQSLVALRHRADRDFWLRQFQIGGDEYAPVVLEGLALVDLSAAFDWLTQVQWGDSVEDAIVGLLPSLLEDFGAGKITFQIERILPHLVPEGRTALLRFCEEERIALSPLSPKEPLSPEDPKKFLAALLRRWPDEQRTLQPEPACPRSVFPLGTSWTRQAITGRARSARASSNRLNSSFSAPVVQ